MPERRGLVGRGRRPRTGGSLLSIGSGAAAFDRETLDLLHQRRELDVETVRLDGRKRRTRIWVVVADGHAYVRSVRGERGYWYQAARERPNEVSLVCGQQVIPVRVVLAADEDSIARCSAALERKYGRSRASFTSMVQPKTLETTLRLYPR